MNIGRLSERRVLTPGRDGFSKSFFYILARGPYQLIGAACFVVAIPIFLRTGSFSFPLLPHSTSNTVVATTAAMLIGAYLLRRLTGYPGTRTLPYLLPVFLSTYAAAISIFFFLRLDYSTLQLLISFCFAIVWFGLIDIVETRVHRPRLEVLPFGGAEKVMASDRVDWSILRSSSELPKTSDGIVTDLRADIPARWDRFLAQATLAEIPVYHWKQVAEALTGQVEVEHLSENTFGSLLPSRLYLRSKRMLDICVAVVLLPLIALILTVAALAIWICDGRPILFQQRRIGRGGHPFTLYKLRTMTGNSASEQAFTEPEDPRVTRIGRFLRRHRIDELPQVINILRGEMSWIGPRPEANELAEWYEGQIPFYSYRHILRPGMTGWAQVHLGNVAEIKAASGKLNYDFYYIKYFSPWLDLLIAAKTIQILLTGKGAH